jgi:hypothetical protein
VAVDAYLLAHSWNCGRQATFKPKRLYVRSLNWLVVVLLQIMVDAKYCNPISSFEFYQSIRNSEI